jgi:hypothetical protein
MLVPRRHGRWHRRRSRCAYKGGDAVHARASG